MRRSGRTPFPLLFAFLSCGFFEACTTWQPQHEDPVGFLTRERPRLARLFVREVGYVVMERPVVEGDSVVTGRALRIDESRVDRRVRLMTEDVLEVEVERAAGDGIDQSASWGAAGLGIAVAIVLLIRS